MDISRLKQLVKQNGDKLILLENNEPDLVVLSFQEYERLVAGNGNGMLPFAAPQPAREPNEMSGGVDVPHPAGISEIGLESEIGNWRPEAGTVQPEEVQLQDLPI